MVTLYTIAILLGMSGLLFTMIYLIDSITRLGIPTRKRAELVLVASMCLVAVGGTFAYAFAQESAETPETANGVPASDPEPAGADRNGVVSDRFELLWDSHGTDLLLAIDTDLPDATEVIVSVDRRYFEVGSDVAYGRDYFSEKAHISKWRTPRPVPIDHVAWKSDLLAHQTKMAKLSADLAFEIARIDDHIGVRAVVHVNQPDPRFGGRGNPNLFGAVVSQTAGSNNWNIIEAEKHVPMPLTGILPEVMPRNVAYDGLQKGGSYRLLDETPLMVSHPNAITASNLQQTLEVIDKTLFIPAGRVVRVVSVDQSNGSNPWYEVEVVGTERMIGWINSVALMRSGVVLE